MGKRSQKTLLKYVELLKSGEVVLCGICGYQIHFPKTPVLGPVTVDHIVARDMGGTSRKTNLQPAHRKCNSHKGNFPEYIPTDRHSKRIKHAMKLVQKAKK